VTAVAAGEVAGANAPIEGAADNLIAIGARSAAAPLGAVVWLICAGSDEDPCAVSVGA
jgi:hypothetical protein